MTRRLARIATLALLALALAGCARLVRPPPGCVALGPGSLCLLPPAALPPVAGQRLLTMVHGSQREDLVSYLRIDARTLRLDNLTLLGMPAFTLTYDGHAVVVTPQRAHVHGGRIVALLELALAPPAALQPRLHGLQLVVTATGERRLLAHGQTLAVIDREGPDLARASFTIRLPSAGVRMLLKPLPGTP